MRRKSEPKLSLLLGFIAVAVVLLNALLAGGSAVVRYYGGFGLAEPWNTSTARGEVEMELYQDTLQVVEIDRPLLEKVPERARFRSEFNSKVKKEAAARIRSLKPIAMVTGRPPSAAGAVGLEPQRQPTPVKPGVELTPGKGPSPLVMRRPTPPNAAEPTQGQRKPSVWKRKLTLRNLTPKNGMLLKVIPGAFPDYLKDIENGEKTLLNTKEWRFASFFNRVKRAVAQHWHPDREYSRRDPKGNVYGFRTRYTILHILLNPSGTLKKIVLERPCGLAFLDEEAIRAFREAAPFPNPPHRLVNTRTQQIAFRFGFVFEITRSPRWRVIRLK